MLLARARLFLLCKSEQRLLRQTQQSTSCLHSESMDQSKVKGTIGE